MSARVKIAVLSLGSVGVALVGVAVAQSACTVLTNDALPDDATFDGPSEASVPACTECLAQACVGTWAVCLADEGCRALRACGAGSSAASCSGQCSSRAGDAADGGPDPAAAYFVFTGCADENARSTCASACADAGTPAPTQPGTCSDAGSSDAGEDAADDAGDAGDASVPDATAPITADACTSCIAGACGDPAKACASGTDCAAFLACVYACTDASCQDACATDHATGKESAGELSSCAVLSCAVQCGY